LRRSRDTNENRVVKDLTVEEAIFVRPTAQISDTLDKKTIGGAVFAVGKIHTGSLEEQGDGARRPHGPCFPGTGSGRVVSFFLWMQRRSNFPAGQ